jgi:hypothetical protein
MDSSSHSSEQSVPQKCDLAQAFIHQSSPAMSRLLKRPRRDFTHHDAFRFGGNMFEAHYRFESEMSCHSDAARSTDVAAMFDISLMRLQRASFYVLGHVVLFPTQAHTPERRSGGADEFIVIPKRNHVRSRYPASDELLDCNWRHS